MAVHRYTPASFGGVVHQITDRKRLRRAYLNPEGVDALLRALGGGEDEEVAVLRASLEERGFPFGDALAAARRVKEDILDCRELVARSGWGLFSYSPLNLSVQLVNHCNAKCAFCYNDSPSMRFGYAVQENQMRAVKDFCAEKGVKLGYAGGEPTLHRNLCDFLEYRGEEVYDVLITNLTPSIDLDRLAGTGIDLVQVSIHGYGELHDRTLQVPGAYRRVLEKMRRLGRDVNVATNSVVTPESYDTLDRLFGDFARLKRELGDRYVYTRVVIALPAGTGFDSVHAGREDMDRFTAAMEGFMAEFSELEWEIPVLHANPLEYFATDGGVTCPAGATVAVARIDGRLSPCNQFTATPFASELDVFGGDVGRAWRESPLFDRFRRETAVEDAVGAAGWGCSTCRFVLMRDRGEIPGSMPVSGPVAVPVRPL